MYLISNANKRTKLLIRKRIFKNVGDNFFFQPRTIPDEPKLISFGNNVTVASGVVFVIHDVIDKVLNNMNECAQYSKKILPLQQYN